MSTRAPEEATPGRRRAWRRELLPLALIVAAVIAGNILYILGVFDPNPAAVTSQLATAAHGGPLLGSSTIDPNAGITAQTLGHRSALDLLHGRVPWWNPFEGVGAPLAGEMQAASLFVLTPLLALPGGQLPFHILLELIAGVATYRLLARLDVGRWVAAGAGCAFALDGTFAWFAHAAVNPIAFLPLLLLGVERARAAAAAGTGHRWALVALALALSVYAGFPETAYLDGLLAVLWALARGWGLSWAQVARFARKLVAGAVVGAMLAAPLVAAFADYEHAAFIGAHGAGFDPSALPHAAVAPLLFPYIFGPIFGFVNSDTSGLLTLVWGNVGGYVTTSILVLDLFALYARRHRPLRAALVVWIVFAFGRIYGIQPLWRIFDRLPDMHQVAAFRYLTPSLELAAVCLAALAIDDIRRRAVPAWYLVAAVAAAAPLALEAAGTGLQLDHTLRSAPHVHLWVSVSLAWGLGMLVLVAVAAIGLRRRLRTAVLVSLLVVDALAMFVVPDFSAPRKATVDVAAVHWLQRHVRTDRVYTLGPMQPDYGSYYGVPEADEANLPLPERYARYVVTHLDRNVIPNAFDGVVAPDPTGPTPLQALVRNEANYEAIGVKYVLAAPGAIPAATVGALGARLVHADRVMAVYRLPHPAPLYSVVRGTCRLTHPTINGVTVDCAGPATVLRRELYMRGWSATEGSTRVRVRPAGPIFQKVRVHHGHARVRFAFVPPHEGAATGALVAGLVLLLAGVVLGAAGWTVLGPWRRWRRRRWQARRDHEGRRAGPWEEREGPSRREAAEGDEPREPAQPAVRAQSAVPAQSVVTSS